jgi:hypothetical protein
VRPDPSHHGETWRIELTNGGSKDCTVLVEQRVFGYYQVEDVRIDDKNGTYSSEEAGKLLFPVDVPAGGKSTLVFTLQYGF